MYEYYATVYAMKSGLLTGTNFEKENKKLVEYLENAGKNGWELVSMTSLPNNSKEFTYELVFKRKKS